MDPITNPMPLGQPARRLAAAALCGLLGFSAGMAADPRRGVPTTRSAPAPSAVTRVAPEAHRTPFMAEAADGARIARIELGGSASLTLRILPDRPGVSGEVHFLVDDGAVVRRTTVDLAALRAANEILSDALPRGAPIPDPAGKDAGMWASVAEAVRSRIGDAAWASFELLAEDLDQAIRVSGADPLETRRALVELGGAAERANGLLEAGLPKSEDCLAAVGLFMVTFGGSAACWSLNGATGGLATGGCLFLTAATAAAFVDILNHCGGGGSGLGVADCSSHPPACMGCEVEVGEDCVCYCPGQECCDWPALPFPGSRSGRVP